MKPLNLFLVLLLAVAAWGQTKTLSQGPHRMEITVERLDAAAWHSVDPGLVFASGDRVRFRFHTNFDGYLYVMNWSTSGKYEQLFPREETGRDNRIRAGREYLVPATQTAFRIAGPPGHEVVYWMVTPGEVSDIHPEYTPLPPPPPKDLPKTMIPRCDDAMFRSRGECIDTSAGPKLTARGEELPQNLAALAKGQGQRDLVVVRQQNTSVVASPVPLTGPVVYEFHLAHR
jgi:hypothetical protein